MRAKREVSDFQSTFGTWREEKPRGSIYLKTFGKDVRYASFRGLDALTSRASFWPGQPIEFSRSSLFLDGAIVLPTAAGLPLRLSVNGTSAVTLRSSAT